jgi:ABC-2 type transport system ATP-binding protein
MVISVAHLRKNYKISKKATDIIHSVKSRFSPEYDDMKAINDISFEVKAGDLVALIGPKGAGKSTILKCLSGLLYPTGGTISVLGCDPNNKNNTYKKDIVFVDGHNNHPRWNIPIPEILRLKHDIQKISNSLYRKSMNELVEICEAGNLLNHQIRTYSLEERIKLELIIALVQQPRVIFLDEPTVGLDTIMQKKIRDFIKTYHELYKSTILFTSQSLEDVRHFVLRILVINQGKIVYDGNLESLVKKYAKSKYVSVLLDTYIHPDKLSKIGELTEYNFPKAVICVPRAVSNMAAAELIREFPIASLNIVEADIEDIIRNIYNSSKYKYVRGGLDT